MRCNGFRATLGVDFGCFDGIRNAIFFTPVVAPVVAPVLTVAPPIEPIAVVTAPAAALVGGASELVAAAVDRWIGDIKPTLKGFARAMYSNTTVLGERDGSLVIAVSNETHRMKCEDHRKDVEAAIAAVVGGKVAVRLVIQGGGEHEPDNASDSAMDHVNSASNVLPMKRSFSTPALLPAEEDEIDLADLVDVPPETVVSPIDRLTQAFPGSHLVEE